MSNTIVFTNKKVKVAICISVKPLYIEIFVQGKLLIYLAVLNFHRQAVAIPTKISKFIYNKIIANQFVLNNFF